MGMFGSAALLVFGCIWVAQVVRRLPADVDEMREAGQGAKKAAIIAIWIVTVVIACWAVMLAMSIVRGFAALGMLAR